MRAHSQREKALTEQMQALEQRMASHSKLEEALRSVACPFHDAPEQPDPPCRTTSPQPLASFTIPIRLQAQAAELMRAQLEAGKVELEREREVLNTSRKELDQLREETDKQIKDAA